MTLDPVLVAVPSNLYCESDMSDYFEVDKLLQCIAGVCFLLSRPWAISVSGVGRESLSPWNSDMG